MSLGDLDELVISCRTNEGRGYIAEAVASYRAGAYRACIVATWIAVVFDLLSKIRELALSGDKAAEVIVQDLAKWQPGIASGDKNAINKSLELERTLVDIADQQFGFFEGMQISDLKRLHEDRNRCAHPTYQGTDRPYAPSAELARAHLMHAVRHVLSQEPVQGKAATDQILRLVESAHFPTDVGDAKTRLKVAGLERARDGLVRSVIDSLVFGMLEGGAGLQGRVQTAIAVRAVCELYPGICEPQIEKALNKICRRLDDKAVPMIFGLHRHFPRTWDVLDDDNRRRLKTLITTCDEQIALRVLGIAMSIPDCEQVCRDRLSTFGATELGVMTKRASGALLTQAVVEVYCGSKNWDAANINYNLALEPVLGELTQMQMRRILNASVEEGADLRGSHSFNNFVRYIYENEKLPRDEIVKSLREQGMGRLVDRLEADPDEIPF